jgi:hypothetical protein
MVLKMLCGSMRRPCGRSTHKFLQILKKMNVHLYISVQDSILAARVPRTTSWRFLANLLEALEKVVQPEGLHAEKGVHIPWVVQVEGNKRFMVGIVVGVVNLQKYQVL